MDESKKLRNEILEHLAQAPEAYLTFSKYQQREDQEMTQNQRKTLAENLLNKSIDQFLTRFGFYLKADHLRYFNQIELDDKDKEDLIKQKIKDILWNSDNRQLVTRNRRYACMLKMIEEKNSYFSEEEMQKRDPELYEEIVGQYMSIAEKQAKNFDPRNSSSLVEILYESIDRQEESLRKANEASPAENFNNDSEGDENSNQEQQWGNFENERRTKDRKRKSHYITKGERDILRDEWIGIMYNNFLSGKDSDFDYSEIDNNDLYDETKEKDQDCQDKYFEEEDVEVNETMKKDEESEDDELDVYMKHIENHIKQQNEHTFTEEFDDE